MIGNKRTVLRVGRAYLAYHALADAVIVVSAISDIVPGYWSSRDFLLEFAATLFAYPVVIPFFIVCGGLHNSCTTLVGHIAQVTILALTIVWWLTGLWALISTASRWWRLVRGARG